VTVTRTMCIFAAIWYYHVRVSNVARPYPTGDDALPVTTTLVHIAHATPATRAGAVEAFVGGCWVTLGLTVPAPVLLGLDYRYTKVSDRQKLDWGKASRSSEDSCLA
jgi:hypothetical protein